jgi:hypothetical protein
MNLHKNARTCPKSRALMVSRVLEDRRPVAAVADSQPLGSAVTLSGAEAPVFAGYAVQERVKSAIGSVESIPS